MSDQQAEQTAEAGASASHASDPLIDTVMASMQEDGAAESSMIASDHEAPKADEPKAGIVAAVPAPRTDIAKSGMPDVAAYKFEPGKAEPDKLESNKLESKAETPRAPGKLMIMSPSDRAWSDKSWDDKPADPKIDAEAAPAPRKSRFAAMAAMAVLALVGGAIGGALATTGFAHVADATPTAPVAPKDHALQASIARIDAEIQTLKAGLDHTSKLSLNQFNKTTDRIDKIEKAQAEPSARLARLSEAVDKLRAAPAAPVAAATPAAREREAPAAKERGVTGSVAAPAGAAGLPMPAAAAQKNEPNRLAVAATPKSEPNRLPVVENWILRDVGHGGALVEGRQGLYEVYAGDPLPGLGRVDGIRKQDGRWVVVTSRGLIVSR